MDKGKLGAGLISPRKRMAMGSGKFPVESFASVQASKPMAKASEGMMTDAGRAVGMPVKRAGGMMGQAAPKHG